LSIYGGDYLFQIGDKIVYPMQGAGVIESIDVQDVQGEKKKYCTIELPINKMKIMIPMDRIENTSIRFIVDNSTLESAFRIFHNGESDESLNYKQRYKLNIEKMKTGKLNENIEVIRDLVHLNKDKKLNTNEMEMLRNARKCLISEVELIKGIPEEQANELLDNRIECLKTRRIF
jgi:CarD family transcriptional regulator, regulator of rRNA transcription